MQRQSRRDKASQRGRLLDVTPVVVARSAQHLNIQRVAAPTERTL